MTELARRLGLHKSTASRLLATLQKRGLVEQDDETGKYRLGLVVIRLAETAERTLDLRGIAGAGARAPRPADPRDDRHRHPRRRHAADGRPGRRPEPHRRRRLDRARRRRSTASRRARSCCRRWPSARSCASSAAASCPVHRADDRRARAAARGAGTHPPARLRDGDRRVRAGAQRGRGPGPRRARQRHRRGRHLGPGLPPDPAAHPGAGGPGPRGRGGDLGPPRRDRARSARPRQPVHATA